MKRLTRIDITASVGLAVAIGATGCSRPHAEPSATTAAPAVAVVKVTRGDLAQTLMVTAEFRPFQEIDVHAKVSGYLKEINVDVGDRVQAGQLLGTLEVPEMLNELQQDQATVSRAAEEINRVRSDLARAESVYDLAHLTADRLAAVMKVRPNLVAQQDIDDATAKDHIAAAQVSTAKEALAVAEQQSAMAKASQAKTETLLGYMQIRAPFAGVITHRYTDTGALIQAGTASQTQAMPIVRLSENSVLRLTIPVPESAVSQIHIGENVTVTIATLHRSIVGTVSRFADKLDEQTRTMQTEVDVKNSNLELVPGMYATAVLTLDERTSALVVPVSALDRDGDKLSVDIIDGDHKVQRRPVTLGLETSDRLEVLSGLQEDNLVVVANRAQLRDGETVTPKLAEVTAEGAK